MGFNDLTVGEYKTILNYYKIPIPINKKEMKRQAEKVITDKLCGCIKQVAKKGKLPNRANFSEQKAIGICTKTIVNSKGITRGSFSCKSPKRNVTLKRHPEKKKNNKKNSQTRRSR
jgi:hypothetical protein